MDSDREPLESAGEPRVDVAILTTRDDEFRALLGVFTSKAGSVQGRTRQYALRRADIGNGAQYTVAILRQAEQGNGEAQDAARDLDQEALAHLVDFFAAAHDEAKTALRRAREHQRIDQAALRAEEMMIELGASGPDTVAEIRARIANRDAEIRQLSRRCADLELVLASGRALLSAGADPSIRQLFPDQIATIERVVYGLYRAEVDARLTDEERERLRDAVEIFLVDVRV